MNDAIDLILERFQRNPSQNLIVGLSGIDGSGKSTLAIQLTNELRTQRIPTALINLDNFLNPKAIRHVKSNQIAGYFEDNFDYDSLIDAVLIPARQATHVSTLLPVLDLETDEITRQRFEFNGPGVMLVEGVFLFKKELRDHFDLKLWLDISFEEAMARVLNRSRDQRYGDKDAIRARYETRFFSTQRFHLERDRPKEHADFVIRR